MAIDYDRMRKRHPVLKRRLTMAERHELAGIRRAAVLNACRDAVAEWDEIGAWPDDWSRWQRALDDAYPLFQAPRLEDLR